MFGIRKPLRATYDEALARVPALRPDVAVLDVRLPDGDGVSVCRELRSRMPELKVIMLTSYSDDEALFDALRSGLDGDVEVHELDLHVNDPEFATAMVEKLDEYMREAA